MKVKTIIGVIRILGGFIIPNSFTSGIINLRFNLPNINLNRGTRLTADSICALVRSFPTEYEQFCSADQTKHPKIC